MTTRVTDASMYSAGQKAMAVSREKMVKNQEQAVTGLRVNRPSDDPVAAMRALGLKVNDKRNEQIATNMQLGHSLLSLADSSLSEMNDLLSRAKELAIQMSSSSNSGMEARLAVANEVEQLQLRAVQIGNTRFGDRFIFGGYQTERAPFDEAGNYFGDSGVAKFEIDRGQKMEIAIPGNVPFLGMTELPLGAEELRQNPLFDAFPTVSQPGPSDPATKSDPNAKPGPATGSESELPKEAIRGPASASGSTTVSSDPSLLTKPKGVNVFSVLKNFSESLRTGNKFGINDAVDTLDKSFQQVLETRTLIGARMNIMESGLAAADTNRVTNAERLSEVQDADSIKVFSDLAKNEHTLNASLQTSSKLLTPSLLDFLK